MSSGIGIAWIGLGGIALLVVFLGWLASRRPADNDGMLMTVSVVGIGTVIVALILGFMSFMPQYRLWRASIEKRILVEEARAQADSAIELARAEVERAKGTAQANEIVAGSITEPYLRYLYINNLAQTDNQVIYLPTEAGLPILEAERLNQDEGPG